MDMNAWTFSAPPRPHRSSRSLPAQPKARGTKPACGSNPPQPSRVSLLNRPGAGVGALPGGYCKRGDAKAAQQQPKTKGIKVLVYLDVDGVLNTTASRSSKQHLDHELLGNLRKIIDSVPGAEIVLSSSWRHNRALVEALEVKFSATGIAPPIGKTGDVPIARPPPQGFSRNERGIDAHLRRLANQRSTEVSKSVEVHCPRAWIAIDDLDLLHPPPNASGMQALIPEHFVHTMDACGLTEERADLAINLLMAQLE
eukprot:gnl/MRDRNA2_/MRDRNA2_132437_c0_seq1.p1 gnl/MRDRNA2_/MRDRNA2_132437_c0~~gnl/MRDRNA2_/MRDRNA2_132437_c0_seq1.p1  ORF type:complete len:255 (+),score=50.48 gnl/MRDRNA2_/MRDRNA2_132437_c0_seq1:218-982(+)